MENMKKVWHLVCQNSGESNFKLRRIEWSMIEVRSSSDFSGVLCYDVTWHTVTVFRYSWSISTLCHYPPAHPRCLISPHDMEQSHVSSAMSHQDTKYLSSTINMCGAFVCRWPSPSAKINQGMGAFIWVL